MKTIKYPLTGFISYAEGKRKGLIKLRRDEEPQLKAANEVDGVQDSLAADLVTRWDVSQ